MAHHSKTACVLKLIILCVVQSSPTSAARLPRAPELGRRARSLQYFTSGALLPHQEAVPIFTVNDAADRYHLVRLTATVVLRFGATLFVQARPVKLKLEQCSNSSADMLDSHES